MEDAKSEPAATIPFGRLVLEGDFVEAYPHLGSTWLVGANGDLLAFDVERFVDERLAGARRTPDAAFAQGRVVVAKADVERYSTIFADALHFKSVLDMTCHRGDAYVATDDGIHRLRLLDVEDLRTSGQSAKARLDQARIHDGRCLRLRASRGMLVAACGDDGAFWTAVDAEGGRSRPKGFERFAQRSVAVEFTGPRVVNAVGPLGFESYTTLRLEGRGLEIAGKAGDCAAIDEALGRFRTERGTGVRLRRAFATRAGILAIDSEGGAHGLSVEFPHVPEPRRPGNLGALGTAIMDDVEVGMRRAGTRVRSLHTAYDRTPGEVIGVSVSSLGTLIETDDAIHFASRDRWIEILREPVFSCRGYAMSEWSSHAFTVIAAGHADLCVAFP